MLSVSSVVEVTVGEGTTIGYFSHVHASVKVGKNCIIGSGVIIRNAVIGDNVEIGDRVVFSGVGLRSRLTKRDNKADCTVVEDGVKIGSGVTIVGNTKIKRCSQIADGAVVIGYVSPETFVAGVPARVIYSLSSIPK